MKRNLLAACAILFCSLAINAQSFVISNLQATVYGLSTDFTVASTCRVTNATNSDKNVMCERIVNNLSAGHQSTFCWDQCYGANTSISSLPVMIGANSYTDQFVGDLRPNNATGTSIVDYKFYDQQNPADFTTISITYVIGATGINDITPNVQISTPRPNPADAFTYVGYKIKNANDEVKVQIVDLLGKVYVTEPLQEKAGVVILSTEELQSGIYFVRAVTNGKVTTTSKLVVSHK
jgi:hypothetical protein